MTDIYYGKGFEVLESVKGVTGKLTRDQFLLNRFRLTKEQKLEAEIGNITAAISLTDFKVYLLRLDLREGWTVEKFLTP